MSIPIQLSFKTILDDFVSSEVGVFDTGCAITTLPLRWAEKWKIDGFPKLDSDHRIIAKTAGKDDDDSAVFLGTALVQFHDFPNLTDRQRYFPIACAYNRHAPKPMFSLTDAVRLFEMEFIDKGAVGIRMTLKCDQM